MSEDMPERMLEEMSEDMPERMSEEMSKGMSEDMSEDMPERMSEELSDRTSLLNRLCALGAWRLAVLRLAR